VSKFLPQSRRAELQEPEKAEDCGWQRSIFDPSLVFAYFFFMYIGLLLSWQRPECNRDFRLE
jgi:hypothetical protein